MCEGVCVGGGGEWIVCVRLFVCVGGAEVASGLWVEFYKVSSGGFYRKNFY